MSNIVDMSGKKFDQSKQGAAGYVVTKFNNMPTDLPISCPKINFRVGRAGKRCPNCEFFKGLLCMNDDPKQAFRQRYRVLCAYPIARSLGDVMEDLDE